MPSILSQNPTQQPQTPQDQAGIVTSIINRIMSSVDPQATFNQVLSSSPDAKNAMDMINQYGGGDPKAAFMNYMNSTGRQNLGQQIMQKFGLK